MADKPNAPTSRVENSTIGVQPWMVGFFDTVRTIGGHLRVKEFAQAERVFERWLDKSRREAAKPISKRKFEHATPLHDVFEERIANALENAGYLTLGSVTAATDRELLQVPNLGTLALSEIRKIAPRPLHQAIHEFLAK